MSAQQDVLDTSATFTLLFIVEAAMSAPLVARLDPWSTLPLIAAFLAWISYRGALAAAERLGTLMLVAFDLHRFDLLAALHLELPTGAESEQVVNQRLADFLQGRATSPAWPYDHTGQSGEPPASAASS